MVNAVEQIDWEQASAQDERRGTARHVSVFRVGKLNWYGDDQLCIVRNISSGGMLIECSRPPQFSDRISVELRSDKEMFATVRWTKDKLVGVAFDTDVDIAQILREERNSVLRVRPRAPRFVREGTARLISDGDTVAGPLVDISIGGVCLSSQSRLRRGEPVVARIDELGSTTGEIRWCGEGLIGVRFERPLSYRTFAPWLESRRRP